MMLSLRHASIGLAALLFVACSATPSAGPDAGASIAGSCDALASACHPYSRESALGKECHDLGHEGDDAKCAPERDRCLAGCPPRDASTGTDAATDAPTDAATDAASPLCTALCSCLDQHCKAKTGYPFASTSSCLETCARWSDAERECFPKWCNQARTTSSNHVCEHAWGGLGLAECDTL